MTKTGYTDINNARLYYELAGGGAPYRNDPRRHRRLPHVGPRISISSPTVILSCALTCAVMAKACQ